MITDSNLLAGPVTELSVTVLDPSVPADAELTDGDGSDGAADGTVLRFANRWYF